MSAFIQYWRIFAPHIPSIAVTALLSIILLALYFFVQSQYFHKRYNPSAVLIIYLIILNVLAICWLTLMPIGSYSAVHLRPSLQPILQGNTEYLLNVLLFLPLSFLLALKLSKKAVVVLIGITLSVLIEISQYVLHIGRISSVDDIIANSIGCLLGVVSAVIVQAIHSAKRNHKSSPQLKNR